MKRLCTPHSHATLFVLALTASIILLATSGCADGLFLDDGAPAAVSIQAVDATLDAPTTSLGDIGQSVKVPPVLTTFLSDGGAVGSLAFRSASGISISDTAPLLLDIDGRRYEAPLTAGPARFSDPDGSVVDQASYRLPLRVYSALINTPVSSISVHVHNGASYTAYPYVSGDLIECPAPHVEW